jgi:hypothetical protein
MSTEKKTKVAVATDLPKTVPLTAAAIQEIAAEAREWREAFAPVKTAMESITPEDLKIRVR